MEWILGGIALVGFSMGVYTFIKTHKGYGAAQIATAVAAPALTAAFCSLKQGRAYGGTNLEFLLHSGLVDGDPLPWILLILWGFEIIFILKAISKRLK